MIQLIVWEYYNGFYREYLIFHFGNDGKPSKGCSVSRRGQGCPSKHLITLKYGENTLLNKSLGRDMKSGLYFLPKQHHNIKRKNGFLEL